MNYSLNEAVKNLGAVVREDNLVTFCNCSDWFNLLNLETSPLILSDGWNKYDYQLYGSKLTLYLLRSSLFHS